MKIYPNNYVENVEKIDKEFMQKNKLEALVLDVDNTLIDMTKIVSDEIKQWAKSLTDEGFKLYILSNSYNKSKVEKVAKEINAPFEFFAKKPFKKGFLKVIEKIGIEKNKIGMVGDQIFTDILGGNSVGMYTILVEPKNKKEYFYTYWRRPIDNLIKKRYIKKSQNKYNIEN